MDRLDELAALAEPVLAKVDEVLTATGAPAGHPVWTVLRRVRLLPGDAVRAVAGLRPSDLDNVVEELRADARACAEVAAGLPSAGSWSGAAAEAYETLRGRVAEQLSGAGESLDERLAATADLAEALADWMARARASLASTIAAVLGSAEVVLLGEPAAETGAAAEIATRLLRTIADSYLEADELLQGSAELAEAVPW